MTKHLQITGLYNATIKSITSSPASWTEFLRSACRNYKCRFDEQVLIYAQRKDATAVLELEKWNDIFGRRVKKGAKGIAVFDDGHNAGSGLKHYFDISDTYENRLGRTVPLWQMKPAYEAEVIESIANSYGNHENCVTLADTLVSTAKNAVEDNISDYIRDMLHFPQDIYRSAIENSVAYMLLTRCGIEAPKYLDVDAFNCIADFNTRNLANAIGVAASDIAEMCLREISATVLNMQKREQTQNRTFAFPNISSYDLANKANKEERGADYGNVDLSDGRRLQPAESGLAGGTRQNSRQIRFAPKEIPEAEPPRPLHELSDFGDTEQALGGDRADSHREDGTEYKSDGGNAGSYGTDESPRPDEMGGVDEQYQERGGGNDTQRPDIQLSLLGEAEDKKTSAFSISQQIIDEVLTSGGNEERSALRIVSYFKKDHSNPMNADFLRWEYGTGGKGFIFAGNRVSVWFDEAGIRISVGDTVLSPDVSLVKWEQAARRIRELLDLGRYMPQSELDKADDNEIKELSEKLWHLNQDLNEGSTFSFIDKEVTGGGFPDSTVLIAKLLEHNEERDKILSGILEFAADYAKDSSLLRFKYAERHLIDLLSGLEDLQRKPLTFTADEPVSAARPRFITQDELDALLLRGSNIDRSKYRIYSYFLQDNTQKEKADFLKEEYGNGGHSRTGISESHNSDGIVFSRDNNSMPYDKITLTWPKVAKRIDELIAERRYMSAQELEYIPEYEKSELSRGIYFFFTNKPQDVFRPYPYAAHYSDAIKAIRPQLDEPERVAEILSQMAATLDNTADFDRAYQSMRKASDNLTAYQNGTFSLFSPVKAYEGPAQAEAPRTVDENVSYDLQLGATVYLGIEEYEINAFSDDIVTLRNAALPLITFEMPRDEFDRKLQENRQNDSLIQISTAEKEKPPLTDEKAQEPDEAMLTPKWEQEKHKRERHNYSITDDNLGAGGQKTRFKANIEAIKALQAIELEGRLATREEQEVLARYSGWGALPQAFDEGKDDWKNEFSELKALLNEGDYNSARASTLNAHYTSPVVIKAIYKAVESMGFKSGNVLEPSCGIGNFFGLLPDSMMGSKMFGIELDGVTGRVAKQLYQKHNISIQGFEASELPDSFFDLAVGNVPFGGYSLPDKRYDKHKFLIHDYFFAKTIDKVRPGGIIAFITSKGTMDKQNSAVRKYIAQRAELLGAIRLPNNAFSVSAGTEVTADILFLQKRDRIIEAMPDWIHLGETENGLPINSYFAANPEMVLGIMSNESGGRMYGNVNGTACVPFPDSNLAEQLEGAIANIHAEITEYERGDDEFEEDSTIPADPNIRNFSYTTVDGQIYYRQDSRMVPVELPVTTGNRVKGLIELRDCVRKLIEYQAENYPVADINAEQVRLNRLYDSFSKKYGLINSRGNNIAFGQDSAYCLLCSLEVLDENGELERKADIFSKRTIKPHIPVTRVDTASEALMVSIAEKARVDVGYMSELTGMGEDTIAKELEGIIFPNIRYNNDTEKTYVTAEEYLSGNIREKLQLAKEAQASFPDGRYDINVRALEAALPQDLTAAEISVRLGATWLPEDVIDGFIHQLLQTPAWLRQRIKARYSSYMGDWSIAEKNADRSNIHSFNTFGTLRVNAYKIIEDSLNLRDIRIFDKTTDENGNEIRVLNKKETAIAQSKQEIIRAKFEEWIWSCPDRRARLCGIYNNKFNSIRPRDYDGSHIQFVGMNPEITLQTHQVNAIARILYGGNALLAHVVGAGKTFEMVAAAMESRRLGLCSKSLIVVPNHITDQWSGEFLQ